MPRDNDAVGGVDKRAVLELAVRLSRCGVQSPTGRHTRGYVDAGDVVDASIKFASIAMKETSNDFFTAPETAEHQDESPRGRRRLAGQWAAGRARARMATR